MNAVPKTLRFLTFALLIVSGTSTAQPIDLRSVVNMGLQDEFDGDQKGGWTDQGANDMRNFPVGEQEFHGITFNIIDPKTNGGKAALVMYGKDRPYFPKRVAISFNTKARTLYFLQAAAWCPSSGEKVADYRLEYLDGEEILVPIVAGAALTNWWDPYPTSDSTVGWVGSNPVGKNVGVNLFWLENPRPEKVIKQIVVQSTGKGVLCILGITASSQELATEFRKPKEDKYRLATEDWFPFELPWDQGPVKGSALDRSFLLDPPAGKHGFLKAQGEQFVFADGTNARFWGVNFSAGANFPTHQQAEKIAERLAGYGINIVRMHHLDAGWTEPNIFDDSYNDTQHLSAESLDRMDYLIYCLKQEGIYVYLDQLVTRYFKPGDEVGIDLPAEPRLKGYTNFVPRLIELQKKYSHDLWTHRNPYTKLRYCDDPAIALMEITNEDDLFTNRNSLLSIFAFGDILKQKWSVWREKQGLQAAAIPIDINDGTFLRFLNDLQIEYYQEMIAYLRALGVKAPITGTNWSRWLQDQPSHAVCDFNDAHAYWDHPADDYTVLLNEPMLKSMKTSFDYMSFSALEGKPFFVSEWDHPWPNFYRAEATAWTAAIAGLQGWNGLALYTYRHNADQAVKHIAGAFETFNDPCYMGLMPTAALLYLRGDVKRAANEYTVKYSLADLFDGKVIENSSQYYQGAAEIAAYRNSFDSAPVDAGEAASIEDTIRTDGLRISDTGQIKRDIKRGILTINTPGTEVVQGFLKGVEAEFAALTIQTDNEFAVFSFSSVDKAEINSARRFLFTAVARADNSNMIYNASRRKALTKGNAPIIVEPVAAAVQLRLDGKFRVWALNEVGERKTEVPVENNRFQISDQYKTIWYEIVKD